MTSFWWIRHAPVIGNEDCCYGNNEVECDLSDTKTFIELEKKLPENSIIITSPLSRAIKTYLKVNSLRCLSIHRHKIDNRVTEQDLGSWAGMKYSELIKKTKKLGVFSHTWLMGFDFCPPGGESFIQLQKRVQDFLNESLRNYEKKNIIIFSHGGPIRAAISIALNIKDKQVLPLIIDNTKLTRIDYDIEKKSTIKFINI